MHVSSQTIGNLCKHGAILINKRKHFFSKKFEEEEIVRREIALSGLFGIYFQLHDCESIDGR